MSYDDTTEDLSSNYTCVEDNNSESDNSDSEQEQPEEYPTDDSQAAPESYYDIYTAIKKEVRIG